MNNINFSIENIDANVIRNIDIICEKYKYIDNDNDFNDLINKYNIIKNKSIVYYIIGSYIVHKIHRYGELDIKSKDYITLFENISQQHINTHIIDKGIYHVFEGLIKFNLNIIYGLEQIKLGVELLIINKNKIYLSGDFLYGAKLITKIPINYNQINIEYNEMLNKNYILRNDNIKIMTSKIYDYTDVYINFTTDIIYFMSFVSSFIEIIKNTYLNENINNIGFFWNIIIDNKSYTNKNLMNEFIIKCNSLFNFFNNKNSIIITTQIFDIDINDKALFTTYRFINMYNYLQITQKPIIQSDIDFDNLKNVNKFINKIKDYDIGLFRVKSTPWRKICATLSYFSDENTTYKFSYIYGVFLNYLYNFDSNNWFIDQLCLCLTENYLNNTIDAEINICSIYKYAKGIFNYSTPYKKQHLDEFNTLDKFNTRESKK